MLERKEKLFEAYTLSDLKKIESFDDVCLLLRIREDLNTTYSENEITSEQILELLKKYEKLLKKNKEKKASHIENEILHLCYKISDELSFYFDSTKEDNLNLFREILKGYIVPVKINNFKPIDLTGKKEGIFINGRGNTIRNLEIDRSNGAALFTGVGCDLTISNLNFENLVIRGNKNVSTLVCADENVEGNSILLRDVDIKSATIYGSENVSELVVNANNANVAFQNVHYLIEHNGKTYEETLKNLPLKGVNHYRNILDYEIEEKPFTRTHK